MSIQPVPSIDPVPLPVPHRADPETFSERQDANVDWQASAPPQFQAVAENVVHNATEALNSATAAANSATAAANSLASATDQANIATTQANTATNQAGIATTKATEASASAATAASSAAAFTATSASSVTIGGGTRNFVTQAAKQLVHGELISMTSAGAPTNRMFGSVDTYVGTALAVTITDTEGSGTFSDWVIAPAGARGPAGSLAGGNLTGALNEVKGADVASAATPDIWASGGNYEVITGTANITGFAAAPQAGARRRLLAGAAFQITAGVDMIIKGIVSGQSYTATAGDEIEVVAESTTRFRLTVFRGDGAAIAGLNGAYQNVRRITTSGSYTATKTGWHRITLTGSAGRGGNVLTGGLPGSGASGGGAPGLCIGMRFLIAGQSYTFVIASGVAQLSQSTANTATPGVAGSATSFSGTGVATMTANGGGAGNATLSAAPVTGAPGGTASGGDINVTGGGSGAISGLVAGSVAATGGGAVGLQGQGFSSGSAAALSGTGTASGGAGTGGASGNASNNGKSGGGGAGGPSAAANNTNGTGGPNWEGVAGGPVAAAGNFTALFNATGSGSDGGSSTGSLPGAGSGANITTTVDAGTFAGSGGCVSTTGVATSGKGGLYGGGSGGAVGITAPVITGATQGGLALIEF